MRTKLAVKALLLAVLLFAPTPWLRVLAQSDDPQGGRTFSQTFPWGALLRGGEMRVNVDGVVNVDGALLAAGIKLESLPSGVLLHLSSYDSVTIDSRTAPALVIKLGRPRPPDPFDDRLRITVEIPPLDPPQAPASTQTADDAQAQLTTNLRAAKALRETVRGWLAYAKTTREKHLFVSPGVSAPGGGGGELGIHPALYEGNILNMKQPINQIDFGLDMDKGSATSADSNFLNMGFNFKKIIPLQRSDALCLIRMSRVLEGKTQEPRKDCPELSSLRNDPKKALAMSQDFRESFFRALVITPFSPRLETNLKALKPGPVQNFINNTEFQLRTGTKALMLPNLLWSLKLIPFGFESGVTIRNKDLPLMKGQGILRLNTGAEGKIAFHFPCHSDLLANRIQLEFKAINRHLVRDESAFDLLNKRSDALVHGNKYSIQTDFKYVFGFVTPIPRFKRRPTIVVTYKNGFFPPTYIFNNAVTFHFTLESDDNENVSDIKAN